MSNHNLELVKLEPNDTDDENELQDVEDMNDNPKIIIDATDIKGEVFEFVELETFKVKDENVLQDVEDVNNKPEINLVDGIGVKEEVLESIKQETCEIKDEAILVHVDGFRAAAENRRNKALDSTIHICRYCHKNFSQGRELSSHIITYHRNEGNLNDKVTVKCKNRKPVNKKKKNKPKSFYEPRHLGSHVLSSHTYQTKHQKIHKCQQCEYETVRVCDFNRHVLNHSSVSLFKCEFCSKGFNRRYNFDSHLLLKHRIELENTEGMKIYSCVLCEYETLRGDGYERHITCHKENDEFKCNLCEFIGVSKRRLEIHQKQHQKKNLSTCKFCYKRFSSTRSLNYHTVAFHQDDVANLNELVAKKIHRCSKCSFKTLFAWQFRRHLVRHNKVHTEKLNVCGYKTLDSVSHIECHKKNDEFKCDLSEFIGVGKRKLDIHQMELHEKKLFMCKFCYKRFSSTRSLNYHTVALHQDEVANLNELTNKKIHECPKCSFKTVSAWQLKRHLVRHKKAHVVKLNVCEVCGYKTLDRNDFLLHTRKHLDLKHFVCSGCDKRFNFKNTLESHILLNHSDNEGLMSSITSIVYTCDDCNFKTIQIREMETHKLSFMYCLDYL